MVIWLSRTTETYRHKRMYMDTPRQPTRLTTTNAIEIYRREWLMNTCLGTTWSVANCSQTDIYSLWPLIDISRVCCSLSRWLSLCNRCDQLQLWRSNTAISLIQRICFRPISYFFFFFKFQVMLSHTINISKKKNFSEKYKISLKYQ